ncbi:MAG: T9SS type A sorting domain-containing protein [Flavobacteriales bacterium]|nr:T9SS type A sorting domain-containing protein [Flavobacteriales bacterium]
MKKILLGLIAVTVIGFNANAQSCAPDPFYMDSSYGAWPDTITNFVPAQEGVFYSEVLDFKLPSDAGDIDPLYSGIPVDSAVLTDVTGLPPGLTYVCDQASCSWLGGAQGCASLFGTPTVPGSYDVVIELDGYITVPLIGSISQPATFTGYVIVVSPAAGISIYHKDDFAVSQNSPNPFGEETRIDFKTGTAGEVTLRVMNLLGSVVHTQQVQANPGDNTIRFKNNGLSNGVYVYTLSNGLKSVTKKMTIRR